LLYAYIDNVNVKEFKKSMREKIWRLMEELDIARFPRPVFGRIPNFIGAETAAKRLFNMNLWKKARIVKVNPDSPQKPVRKRALEDGKILLMPTPRIRRGFLLINPNSVPRGAYSYASTIRGAFIYGKVLNLNEIPKVDLIVIGSVVVDIYGTRIGKGGGYAELEYGILREVNAVNEKVPVVTTVHEVQVVKERLPREKHDLPVDVIITPKRVLTSLNPYPKPAGIYWDILDERKISQIPILGELKTLMKNR